MIGSRTCRYPEPVEVQTRADDAELRNVRSQSTDDNLLSDSSEEEDSILSSVSTTSGNSPSFLLVEYRTEDSPPEHLPTSFVNIEPTMTGLFEFPADIYSCSDTWPMLDHLPCLYKTPRTIHDDMIPFLLSYHRRNITYGRYFWYGDHHRFIKKGLFDLAKQSDSLRYAIAAFSALIYSIQVDNQMKKLTFHFYAKAIQVLQQVINTNSVDSQDSVYTTVATILELASVEVRPYIKGLMIAGSC